MAALALSRLSSRFDASKTNSDLYIWELENFDDFEYVMQKIKDMIKNGLVQDESADVGEK